MIDVTNWTDLQNLGIGALLYLILDRIFTFIKPFVKPEKPDKNAESNDPKPTAFNSEIVSFWSNTIGGIMDSKLESRFDPLLPVLTALNATCQRMEILISRATTMLEERRDRDSSNK